MVSVVSGWTFPQTQDFKGEVVSLKEAPIAGAVCTLTGNGLPEEGITLVTGEKGGFDFPGLQPGKYDLACAAVDHLPLMQRGLEVTPAAGLFVRVVLPGAVTLQETMSAPPALVGRPVQRSVEPRCPTGDFPVS